MFNGMKKKHIVFFSPSTFQAAHLDPVISTLSRLAHIKISLVGEFEQSKSYQLNTYRCFEELPFFEKYDMFVLTEMRNPANYAGLKVFFGHGIGPKLTYQSNPKLQIFDYLFVPCKPIFDIQNKLSSKAIPIGLPIIDKKYTKEKKLAHKNSIESIKVVYAPSWHSNPELVSDVVGALKKLIELKGADVVFCPHPNLLNQAKHSHSPQLKEYLNQTDIAASTRSTLDECLSADLVISDISSILFESMAAEIPVIFDGNREIYHESGATHVLNELEKHVLTLDWTQNIDDQLNKARCKIELSKQLYFINNYIFNKDQATEAFVTKLMALVNEEYPTK
ncbi:CDP-glycerol glycerophosphotransferase family protein [bacterium]|nr:CDP-glycerol glycerophosphotransferase family protein [bacterium]